MESSSTLKKETQGFGEIVGAGLRCGERWIREQSGKKQKEGHSG